MKLFGRKITIKVEMDLPVLGAKYRHRDNDPNDLIDFVVPQKVEDGIVTYSKLYKNANMRVQLDTTTLAEFQRYFRRI